MIYKNALISTFNKDGLIACAKKLSQSGTRIVSTGGTAQFLLKNGVPIVPVEEQTKFPEVMDGRVKTLHPHIFLPLLSRLEHLQDERELKKRNLKSFDLVICNLYPFGQRVRETETEQIELIDVGGPSLLRASAKNFEKITVICDPADYDLLDNPLSLEQRRKLAAKTFYHLSLYDSKIARYFECSTENQLLTYKVDSHFRGSEAVQVPTKTAESFTCKENRTLDSRFRGNDTKNGSDTNDLASTSFLRKQESSLKNKNDSSFPQKQEPSLKNKNESTSTSFLRKQESSLITENQPFYMTKGVFVKKLRYGENPHQKGTWYKSNSSGLHQAEILQGKALSFNNILDLQSALNTLREFQEPAFVGVKHNNPCAVALADSLETAVQKGFKADPLSLFGGIIALNKKVSLESANLLNSCFLECIIAPDYSDTALKLLSQKKNLRVLKWPHLLKPFKEDLIFIVDGGFMVQTPDQVYMEWKNFKIEGQKPSKEIKKDLEIAWKVCTHLKSNAIALVSQGQTVGLGMGQVDRVASVHLALERMKKHHPHRTSAPVMASDGFFPFEDAVEQAASENIQWIIQPGGSIRDSSIIKKARSLGVSMILTGCRHFRH